ncbi:anthranilate phosphoribosyltransferase family protein [Oscillatoria sp. FACHB-1407]|uniref:anthranilate phosphoribosyltransferase family protein n=1 Tax=Oscillatoria sp. FACHB-1407 TaxID=2692847 RepID=UPI001682DED8|nr:anthranilate phosphoribosyltransferase family protein [Oscillatoria sp. FACHB-1407]MBD2459827.1 anthranilate phosphoribosyltransferase family protein [Oscillatoria sp. FACHB-1407]
MSTAFRDLLKKVGSGPHTSKELDRQESANATRMMLLQEATPAQIGAFMIAHRIKRPTGEELAGMLDAYEELGPKLQPIQADYPVMVLCSPYDGRDRTVPLSPLTALMLATVGCPVVLHGGDRMPTKEGVPLVDIWRGLGVNWASLTLNQVQQVFEQTRLGFVYLPTHFPLAQALVPYREQIGKRPPFATLELMWSPYMGEAHVVTGFVHPPTEEMTRHALTLRGVNQCTMIKGLEGSCDLPRERTAIIGLGQRRWVEDAPEIHSEIHIERLHLHSRDHGFTNVNVTLETTEQAIAQMIDTLHGQSSELTASVIWNSGFYLWRCGCSPSIEAAIALAMELLQQGQVLSTLEKLCGAIATVQPSRQEAQLPI